MRIDSSKTTFNPQIAAIAMPQDAFKGVGEGFTNLGKVFMQEDEQQKRDKLFESDMKKNDIAIKVGELDMATKQKEFDDAKVTDGIRQRITPDLYTTNGKFDDTKFSLLQKELTSDPSLKDNGWHIKGILDDLQKSQLSIDGAKVDLEHKNIVTEDAKHTATLNKAFGVGDRKLEQDLKKSQIFAHNASARASLASTSKSEGKVDMPMAQDYFSKFSSAYGRMPTQGELSEYVKTGKPQYVMQKDMTGLKAKQFDASQKALETIDGILQLGAGNIKAIAGWTPLPEGMVQTFNDVTGRYTPNQRALKAFLGKLNSEEMHFLYGASLVGREEGRSKVWNLDTDQSPEQLFSNIMGLRKEILRSYKIAGQGVYHEGYKPREDFDVVANKQFNPQAKSQGQSVTPKGATIIKGASPQQVVGDVKKPSWKDYQ